MPKFKIEAPSMVLADNKLERLGMKSALNQPKGSANFGGIAPRSRDNYLALSEVFRKTLITAMKRRLKRPPVVLYKW